MSYLKQGLLNTQYNRGNFRNMHIVRPLQLADCSSVSELLAEVLSEACFEDTMKVFARQLSWDSELILVAESQGDIVGVIIGTIDGDQGYYYRIAVKRRDQRKGIGKSLIQHLKQRFTQRKVKRIVVSADVHNEPVLPLYEALGYSRRDFVADAAKLKIVNG